MFFDGNYFGFLRKVSGTTLLSNKTKAAGIGVDTNDSYKLKYNANGTVKTVMTEGQTASGNTFASATLTSPVITTPTMTDLTEDVTATNVIAAAESGTVFFLDSVTEFVSTLPAVAAGLKFTFIVKAAPSGASYTIVPASGTIIHGVGVSSADAGGTASSTAGTGVGTITFVDGQAKIGDRVDMVCDGTLWHAIAFMSDEDGITFS